MRIVTIETSCDETSVALLDEDRLIKHYIFSQVYHHRRYRGVVPEIASRLHSEKLYKLLKKLDLQKNKPDYIGFTRGPGLKGSLLVGRIAAEVIGNYFEVPVYGLNHLEGHLYSVEIENDRILNKLKFPLITLIISGGHSELWYVEDYGKYKLLGSTRDDAVGEAFDKVAKLIGLNYPGGPEIEKFASKCKKTTLRFTVPEVKNSYDYSFSGIKTQVSYYVRDKKKITLKDKIEISYAFQKAVVESLYRKLYLAVKNYKVYNVVICGGVSVNSYLRNFMVEKINKSGVRIYFPDKKYTSDNAAMMAVLLKRMLERKKAREEKNIEADLKVYNWG